MFCKALIMKQVFFCISIVLVAILSSCSDQEDMSAFQGQEYDKFTASIESCGLTKAHFSNSHNVNWSEGDAVQIFSDTDAPQVFQWQSDKHFTGGKIEGKRFYAYYPSAGERESDKVQVVRFQKFDAVFGHAEFKFPMVATSTNNNLYFKQTCGALHFIVSDVTDDYSIIRLKGNKDELIWGDGIVNLEENMPIFMVEEGNGADTYEASIPNSVKSEAGIDVYFVIPPTTFSKGFTLQLCALDTETKEVLKTATIVTDKTISVGRAEMLRYELSFSDFEEDVSEEEGGEEEEEEELDDDDSQVISHRIKYHIPTTTQSIGPDCIIISPSDFDIWATMEDNVVLQPKLKSFDGCCKNLNDGRIAIQGNTEGGKRRIAVQARFWHGNRCVLRKTFYIEQDYVDLDIKCNSNKDDFYEFRDISEGENMILYYSPCRESHPFTLTTNYMNHLSWQFETQHHSGQQWANDGVVPTIVEQKEISRAGNNITYEVSVLFDSNRNYYEQALSGDSDEIYYVGQYRHSTGLVKSYVKVFDDWDKPSTLFNLEAVRDFIVKEYEINCLQSGIKLDNNRSWYHETYPLADFDIPGYSRTVSLNSHNEKVTSEFFVSNVDWEYNDVSLSNPSWGTASLNYKSQHKYKYYWEKSFDLFFQENPIAAERISRLGSNELFRNESDINWRDALMYVNIDLKDERSPMRWPVMHIVQLGVPKIEYDETRCHWDEWTSGSYSSNGKMYSLTTKLHYYLNINRNLGIDMSSFQIVHASVIYNYSFKNTDYYRATIYANNCSPLVGVDDARFTYPNGREVYAVRPFEFEYYEEWPQITSDGIGEIQLDMPINKIPRQIPGLYDKISLATVEVYEEGGYHEYVQVYRATWENERMFDIYHYDGKISSIQFFSPRLKTIHGLGVNSTPDILFFNNAKFSWFNNATDALYCDGAYFYYIPMTPAGYQKAADCYVYGMDYPFYASDYQPDGRAEFLTIWVDQPDSDHPVIRSGLNSCYHCKIEQN